MDFLELIAPDTLFFYNKDWVYLQQRDRSALTPLIEETTKIDRRVFTSDLLLQRLSIAKRMSWAAHRETSRIEDEAYCLLGIFGVSGPTAYGEGEKAFSRLQEENHEEDDRLLHICSLRAGKESAACIFHQRLLGVRGYPPTPIPVIRTFV
jgi:hypothetical protein